MGKYVYGIVKEKVGTPAVEGIAGAPVHAIGGGGAAAIVSDLSDDELRLGREEILVHANVLEQTLAQGTVLPMRFGVVMSGEDDVRRRLLESHASELKDQLGRFEGRIELNLRAVYEEAELMREVVQEDPEIARLRDSMRGKPEDATYFERIKLGELVAAAVQRKREIDASDIVDALAPIAAAVEVAEPSHERVALTASFLVERERQNEFDERLDLLARKLAGRIRFKCVGPLPPHSFVELTGSL